MNMISISDIRKKYPQYDKLSDTELADKLYDKYYSDKFPKNEYYQKIGLGNEISNSKPSNIDNELQKKLEQESWFGKLGLGIPSSHIRNPLAGLLQSGKEMGELYQSAIPPKGWSPFILAKDLDPNKSIYELIRGGEPAPGVSKAKEQNTWLQRFDPYKAMGVKEEGALQSVSGAEQALGEFGVPSYLGVKGLYQLGKSAAKLLPGNKVKQFGDIISRGGKSLEESGERLANQFTSSFSKVKSEGSKKFEDVFSKYNSGEQKIGKIESIDKSFINELDPEIESSYNKFNSNPNVRNAHKLQSELSAESRWLEKQIILAKSKGESTSKLKRTKDKVDNYLNYVKNRISSKLDEINPVLSNEYRDASSFWKKNVIPYTSNKDLMSMVSGRNPIRNPGKEMIRRIFKNPEEDINTILQHMGPDAQNDIIYQLIGKQVKNITKKSLPKDINKLSESGYEKFITPDMEKLSEALERHESLKSRWSPYVKGGVGGILAEEVLRHLIGK